MIKKISILTTDNTIDWQNKLETIGHYEFYHLPTYHKLHEIRGEGRSELVVYQEVDKIIALPLIVRRIDKTQGLENFSQFYDATSVYGYPGPIANDQAKKDEAFLLRFKKALEDYAQQARWVSVFSRMNPIFKNHCLLEGIGTQIILGNTVAIDLSLNVNQQSRQYSSNHKRNIKKLRRSGADIILDQNLIHLRKFVNIYRQTMQRVNASSRYFFSKNYFEALFNIKEQCSFHLFLCELNNEIVSGGIFSECCGVVQYHLGATATAWLKLAPMKLIFDEVRLWATSQGYKWFHLGGGVGSSKDSLFRFKTGFSTVRFPFFIWKWIVKPEIYDLLVEKRLIWLRSQKKSISGKENYFPKYRL